MSSLFTKGSLSSLTISCHVCLDSHNVLALLTEKFGGRSKPTKWIKKKAVSLVWLVLSYPLKAKKKLLFEQENLVNIYLKLKSENVNRAFQNRKIDGE